MFLISPFNQIIFVFFNRKHNLIYNIKGLLICSLEFDNLILKIVQNGVYLRIL